MLTLVLPLALGFASTPADSFAGSKPHLLFALIDDLGWSVPATTRGPDAR